MKARLTFFFLVCILASCQRTADIESVNVPPSEEKQTVLPKISKDIESLTAADAVKVAKIFANGGVVLTKSSNQKTVKSVVPIKGSTGEVLMYAVNYSDGYTIVSATKKYHPVLASVEHGTYTGEPTGTGQDILMHEYLASITAAMNGSDVLEGDQWCLYEEVINDFAITTKVSSEYSQLFNDLAGIWTNAGYNVYRLNQKPDNMPDDVYETFCDMAMDYNRHDHPYMECSVILEKYYQHRTQFGPYLSTSWDQGQPYNNGLSSALDLGCTTVAIGQIMRYLEYPRSINWEAMPNAMSPGEVNTTLTDFLAQLRGRIGVDNYGNATSLEVKDAISNYYGYTSANGFSVSINSHNETSVCSSLARDIPVYMRGTKPGESVGHAWVCDGYYATNYQTDYELYVLPMGNGAITEMISPYSTIVYPDDLVIFLYYHMNWGWGGEDNGYYSDSYLGAQNYTTNRKELIITRR